MIEQVVGHRPHSASLDKLGLQGYQTAYWNLTPEELVEASLKRDMGELSDKGALVISTGRFTGRAPKDRFIVKDHYTEQTVDWTGKFNQPIEARYFDQLYGKVCDYFKGKDLFVRDAYACDHPDYRLNIRVVTEYPWSNQFVYNMFLRPSWKELTNFDPEWVVINAPGFQADPAVDGVNSPNFAIIHFARKTILVGGTGYTGEIKKGIFSVLNYILPQERNVLSMHCSANIGPDGDTAVFFGLSGTGKTTLSADPERELIGDDEHAWCEDGVFNFEGGCYAKCIDLTEEKEPDIYRAIRHRAILENIVFKPGTREPDYSDKSITENTRVSYPIDHIANACSPSRGGHPHHIFFLTCDAYGVLPPLSRLTPGQAMYHFISGYTAKVAGTEDGIKEPQTTFSACFGAPFLPLHPTQYAEMLGERMQKHEVRVWLVNTGWTGGGYGVGNRMSLKYTRAMIRAAMQGQLDQATYQEDPIFGLHYPTSIPGVPSEVLNPKNTWKDQEAYDQAALKLAGQFARNFSSYADQASEEILAAAPRIKMVAAN
ncbi:MAG: phosphoenolpyruvate carboxykinase (ATP) [Lewinellaceae bacterium]|nr:phosphoenolpyruvate carboxykinase (ATP) [Saprospiraceae bacterium]MCB9312003.1 phosphoenolpyruvate carboxykinase (ATP) [Lewinellaceae bacterium]HRW76000.1 phosphoenolpyruvate carboxykinase (ATP) [Saprospiraceae bacterium]